MKHKWHLIIVVTICMALLIAASNIKTNDIGCIAYNNGNGWAILNDADHEPINVDSAECNDEYITIHFKKSSQVATFNVTPDETLASYGYIMGASVGLDKALIFIYDKEQNLVNPNDIVTGNIWISGLFVR